MGRTTQAPNGREGTIIVRSLRQRGAAHQHRPPTSRSSLPTDLCPSLCGYGFCHSREMPAPAKAWGGNPLQSTDATVFLPRDEVSASRRGMGVLTWPSPEPNQR
jgi:hypothetical protein